MWRVLLLLIFLPAPLSCAAETTAELPTADEVGRRLVRVPPKSTDDAIESFTIQPGFRVELVAAEPEVVDPIAMSFDADGRIYVVEMRGYSEDEELQIGRIRRLEDRDDDGRYETSSVFVDHLSWPTAVHCYADGVVVGVAPEIRFYRDTDGDGRADESRTLARGFSRDNVQGLLNSFTWGLDNLLHGATSSSGANLVTDKQPTPISLRGRDFAWNPRTDHWMATSGGGQHGMSFSPWGEKLVCSNSDHVQLVMYDDAIVARNPYFTPLPVRQSIATDGPQADVFRTSAIEPWRIVRTELRVAGLVPGPVEGGGTPAGYFTSATGLTVYHGNAWQNEFEGWVYVCDVGSNLVHRKRLIRDGVGYQAVRVDTRSEFVTSDDLWFRPVQLANGPDGALYILDMYREFIEHPLSLPPLIKQHMDLTSGRDRGRIYRVVPDNFTRPKTQTLSDATSEELVALIAHPNGWQRETAARLLVERQDRSAIPALQLMLTNERQPESRLRALYVVRDLGGLNLDILRQVSLDQHEQLRRHAIKLSEPYLHEEQLLPTWLLEASRDESVVVRYQLAASLGESSDPRRVTALADIARRSVDHPYVLMAVQSSACRDAVAMIEQLGTNARFTAHPNGFRLLESLTSQLVRQADVGELTKLRNWLVNSTEQSPEILEAVLTTLWLRSNSTLRGEFTSAELVEKIDQVVGAAEAAAIDETVEDELRIKSIQLLPLIGFSPLVDSYDLLLHSSQPLSVQVAAARSLRDFNDSEAADLLIQRWAELGPEVRRAAADTLLSKRDWHVKIVDALEQSQIVPGEIDWILLRQALSSSNPDLLVRLDKLTAATASANLATNSTELLKPYLQAVAQPGNREHGRQLYTKHCSSCHQVEGQGHAVGPSLSAMVSRGSETIATNVLLPNLEVNPQYVSYTAITMDGRVFSGIITGETSTSVTLNRGAGESTTVLRVDLETMRSTGVSLMPEGFAQQLSPQDMSDLVTYLMSASLSP